MQGYATAVRYLAAVGRGATRPHLFLCDDGCSYVVKTFVNPQGPRMIPNEWIAYRLGKLLDLPIPEARLVRIPQAVAKSAPQPANPAAFAGPGPHFGSRFDRHTIAEPTPTQLAACNNLDRTADMIVFDNWIKNWDRAWRRGKNILIQRGRTSRLVLIDHGGAFTGTMWNPYTLLLDNLKRTVYWGENYRQFVKYIDGPDPLGRPLQAVEELPNDVIREAVSGLPESWGVNRAESEALARYLIERKRMLRQMVRRFIPHFPVWRSHERHSAR